LAVNTLASRITLVKTISIWSCFSSKKNSLLCLPSSGENAVLPLTMYSAVPSLSLYQFTSIEAYAGVY